MAKITVNLKGLKYSMPIVRTAMAVKKGAPGDEFEIMCDNPGFDNDIRRWCSETGNHLEGISQSGNDIVVTIIKK